jgi:putative ABC transport system ATP-binding protein
MARYLRGTGEGDVVSPSNPTLLTPLIEARNLSKQFTSGGAPIQAISEVNLVICRGEMVAITGPSGCGKSTLLHLIGALDSPSAGEVHIAGQNLADMGSSQLARLRNHHIGFVFQLFNLLPTLTVEENIALPAVIDSRRASAYRTRVRELLASFGLESKASRFPTQLSGGEQQRVAIARALMMDPAILLADEPTGNLDSRTGSEVMGILRRLHSEGRTVVFVTHEARLAVKADRVVFMRDGHVVDLVSIRNREDYERALSQMIEISDQDIDPLLT